MGFEGKKMDISGWRECMGQACPVKVQQSEWFRLQKSSKWGRGRGEGQRERESSADAAVSTEPDTGLNHTTLRS